jgi:GT2 family glycosyltransferase
MPSTPEIKYPTAPAADPTRPRGAAATVSGNDPLRPRVAGKFLFVGDEKYYVRGVTYGPFKPQADGCEYHDPPAVERDFADMAANGVNAVRVYTVPPRWLLDLALKYSLRVLVGMPWEQHIAFLDDARRRRDLERRVRVAARSCAGHPALLGFAIGNEIPAPIVRWYGHRRVEAFLERLYWAVKDEDPEALVTYVNYPSTEYLDLPFLDFVAFNVYLESQDKLEAYVARLQNIADERPLVMAELGLDSLRKGAATQARTLEWQVRTLLAHGCAGLFVFAWTDEWYRGGHDIEDWDFGLTTRTRMPKPALESVRDAFRLAPFAVDDSWPFISVVICTHNGSRTIRESLEALRRVSYPKFEVIVVDDGSRDATAAIAREYNARLISQENKGLSAARNVGWREAKGQIVAYLDDDAAPDVHWLHYLASAFLGGDYAGVGGPNIAFAGDKFVAQCVDHAPGNPTHVLITDREAEHLPGCNMAYRRSCLVAVDGFDTRFRIAGDDVDLCWRLQEQGWKLAFHPGAMVWHHRRGSLRAYWRQQLNYGRAEAMIEQKWPEKYNAAGHVAWNGRLYQKALWQMLRWSRRRIYHGTWGSALFQSVYNVAPGKLSMVLMMPEWYLLMALLGLLSVAGLFYAPLRFSVPLLALAFVPPAIHACRNGWNTCFRCAPGQRLRRLRLSAMTALLHFLQPAARLAGRLRQGLTPWRRRGGDRVVAPRARSVAIWSERCWRSAEQRLAASRRRCARAALSWFTAEISTPGTSKRAAACSAPLAPRL